MKTPIVDFLNGFVNSNPTRLHMPGHKGKLGYERDITEVSGADSLYHADGIILESEKNAGELFGTHCFYSAEGSSLSIRAMLYLALLYARENGKSEKMLAARNVHKSFISAAALLDLDVDFIGFGEDYLSSTLDPNELATTLDAYSEPPLAVYITTPDYLGRMQDVKKIAEICHARGILCLCDNAHGAYLAFLEPSMHPIALGADMCADSAHKTLPALTGASYLHLNRNLPSFFAKNAKGALALFGSTSPSYTILESLDRLNGMLDTSYKASLHKIIALVTDIKSRLSAIGYTVIDGEPLKITVNAADYGYSGFELGAALESCNIYPEFYDNDYLVLMVSESNTERDLHALYTVLSRAPKKSKKQIEKAGLSQPKKAMSIRDAMLSPRERISVDLALGRILADTSVACPPAVPILVPGEIVCEDAVAMFKRYGYNEILVLK